MQREAAHKFSDTPKENLFSLLAKPRFDIRIVCEIHRTDFVPVPGVGSALLHIQTRPQPCIRNEEYFLYSRFVRFGFGRWKKDLQSAYRPVITYEQWKRLSSSLGFTRNARPTELTFEQWLGLFDCFKQRVLPERQAGVLRGRY